MKLKEYFEYEGITDVEIQADFIEYIADVDEINIESVKELDYSIQDWDDYRNNFLDIGD